MASGLRHCDAQHLKSGALLLLSCTCAVGTKFLPCCLLQIQYQREGLSSPQRSTQDREKKQQLTCPTEMRTCQGGGACATCASPRLVAHLCVANRRVEMKETTGGAGARLLPLPCPAATFHRAVARRERPKYVRGEENLEPRSRQDRSRRHAARRLSRRSRAPPISSPRSRGTTSPPPLGPHGSPPSLSTPLHRIGEEKREEAAADWEGREEAEIGGEERRHGIGRRGSR
jgi:hypothetical protein